MNMTAETTHTRHVDKASHPSGQTIVHIGKTPFGGRDVPLIAGPYSGFFTERAYEALAQMASVLTEIGVRCLYGQVFSNEVNVPAEQGALTLLSGVAQQYGMSALTHVADTRQAELAYQHVDAFVVGERYLDNTELLQLLGQANRPVILRRNPAVSIQQFLNAVECVLNGGNPNVILCETGVSPQYTQVTTEAHKLLDLGAVALLKELTHLPVIADPSEGTGQRNLVFPLSRAAIACGVDGLVLEIKPNPLDASEEQAISAEELGSMTPYFVPLAFSVSRNLLLEPSARM
jgi:3-deoxy-7-phosphoheptulonate synthase